MKHTREKKIPPKLKSRGNDLTKRWRVEYFEPTHNNHGKKRVAVYGDINQADTITFLLTGKDKAEVLKIILNGAFQPDQYPAHLIKPASGHL